MNAPAPGQLLGYGIQFPRALYHLLKSGPGSAVSIELNGDVTAKLSSGVTIAEEDKSSLIGNPVTDRSADLWKTFANWVDAVNGGVFNPANTRFVLFRNKSGKEAIVESFHEANTAADATNALKNAITSLSDLKDEHEAWKYYKKAALDNQNVLINIIERFSLETGSEAAYSDFDTELTRLLVGDAYKSYVTQSLSGWLLKTILEKIASRKTPEVTWEEFRDTAEDCVGQARRRELVDFALMTPPRDSDVLKQRQANPTYIKQLSLIACSEEEIFESVTAFLKAKTNRDRWIGSEVLSEIVAMDFDEKLRKNFSSVAKDVMKTQPTLSPEDQGQVILARCIQLQTTIGQTHPPSPTIEGTYHKLADTRVLGWHPSWKSHLP